MQQKELQVTVPHGIHLRVASAIAQMIRQFQSKVLLTHGKQQARADSVLEMVLLEATENSKITITANGKDEKQVIAKFEEFFTDGGGI